MNKGLRVQKRNTDSKIEKIENRKQKSNTRKSNIEKYNILAGFNFELLNNVLCKEEIPEIQEDPLKLFELTVSN